MKKMRHISMAIIVTAAIVAVGLGWNLLSDEQIITVVKSMLIPASESESQSAGGQESCGTLYCSGKIIKVEGVVVSIEFSWKADVTFPGDVCMGDIYVPLFNIGSWEGYFPVVNPCTGSAAWTDAKGEHHVWEYKIILYEDDTYMEVYGAIRSTDDPSSFTINIATEPFTLVREGNNFYFLE